MTLEATDITGSDKLVEFFPWPYTDLIGGAALKIRAKWVRFNTPWLTLKGEDSGAERNFSVQGIFSEQDRHYALLRQARMDETSRVHGLILARFDAEYVYVLSESDFETVRTRFAIPISTVLTTNEIDRRQHCVMPLQNIVGTLSDWNLHEGPSLCAFGISTKYQAGGRILRDTDFVRLAGWSQEGEDVFIRLRSLDSGPDEEFQLRWLDKTTDLFFAGVSTTPEREAPDEDGINIYIFHESGAFEVANEREIQQAVMRLFDAAEYGNKLNSRHAVAVFSSIVNEG